MFLCKTALYQKKADKFEFMASWLILGGVLPLAVAIVAQHEQGLSYDSFFTIDRILYLWVIVMGIASLRVKRASVPWRTIVVLGEIGFITAGLLKLELGDAYGIVWPLVALLVISKQYTDDMKVARAKKTL